MYTAAFVIPKMTDLTTIILLCFLVYLVIMNLIAYFLMGADKKKAREHAWRIPEVRLFLPVILGGGIGGLMGMYHFHHKTKHWYFKYGFALITIIWAAALIWFAYRYIAM